VAPRELPAGTVTFLFTDIEGSTRLVQELGDSYGEALRDHRRLLRGAFQRHHGVEVDTQGDAFFYAFARASDAVGAARDGQSALEGGPMRARMGIHTGEAELGDEGYVGVDVHRAARICGAAHGGQVLLSDTTARLVDADLHDLGYHRLKDLFAPVRLYQLGHADFPSPRTLNFTNLPVQATPLVGRQRELEETAQLLGEHRLVTLVGPGGTGKTRLALQVAAEAADEFTDGVFWVPLVTLRDPALVEPAIAQAVGVTSNLGDHLVGKRVLFLVDNFEHLLAAAGNVATLLDTATAVKFLVTSREPLRLSAEWEYPVPSLPHDDAVALFVARARAQDPAFDSGPAVAEICRRLDGLPLAIELATARTNVLSPEQVLERLGDRLALLTKGVRDAPDRQRTLRATIDWSHQLLSDEERELFARLAIFAGGWTLEAAEAICAADLDTLEGLVSKHLVTHTRSRFGMLETIREYARERLRDLGAEAELAERHAQHFLALTERITKDVAFGIAPAWEQRRDEDANIMLALEHFISTGKGDLELRLAAAAWEYWFTEGQWTEARRAVEHALSADVERSAARAAALRGAAWMTGRMGDIDEAKRLGEEGLETARAVGDDWMTWRCLSSLAVFETWSATEDGARKQALLDEAARMPGSAEDPRRVALASNNAAVDMNVAGDHHAAVKLGERAASIARQIGARRVLCLSLPHLAEAERALGEYGSARAHLLASLTLARELGFREVVLEALNGLALVSASAGDYGWTAALFGAAQREAHLGWVPERGLYEQMYADASAAARGHLGDAEYQRTFAAGGAMPLDAVADYVETSGAAAAMPPVDVGAALDLLRPLNELRLHAYTVVGDYARFDESIRSALADARQSIVMGLHQPGHKRNVHLLWASPGSGKTYFVQQVAASLPDAAYGELNLAKSDEGELRTFLDDVMASPVKQICFIDECDAKPSEPWPYELMLPALDAAVNQGMPVVFVLAGSSGSSVAEMQERMSSRPKGSDVISRIPHGNVHSISPLGIGDRVLVAVSQLRAAAAEAGHTLSAVEKMALFYIAIDSRLGSPRQLRELCARAAERLLPGEERLRYDHLFSPGNPENKAFWNQWQAHHRALVGRFVDVSD
jgi:predicted ATPase/class 3 adenylate cyclase